MYVVNKKSKKKKGPASQCLGKAKHETEGRAWAAVKKMRKDRKIIGRLNAYQCKWCCSWHVGGR